ncbi:MAG: hypothetical protein O2822_00985 [Chloroflexi bacterium]|nr:hypothetical protein [Chloroflexota bacterium]
MILVAVIAFIVLFALFVVVPTQVQKRHHRRDLERAKQEEQQDPGPSDHHITVTGSPASATE